MIPYFDCKMWFSDFALVMFENLGFAKLGLHEMVGKLKNMGYSLRLYSAGVIQLSTRSILKKDRNAILLTGF